MLEDAEALAEAQDRSAEDDARLSELLSAARDELRMAEELGYGSKKDYRTFHRQIDEIERKTADGEVRSGWFDEIKKSLGDFRLSFFDN